MTVEVVASIAALFGTVAVGTFAFLRTRGAREERGEQRLWKRVEKVERRLDDCEKRHDDCEGQRRRDAHDYDEKIEALQTMLFRQSGIGEDTGRFLIDEAREQVRSKRPSPPPVKRERDE